MIPCKAPDGSFAAKTSIEIIVLLAYENATASNNA
jgi:hypothetical protein